MHSTAVWSIFTLKSTILNINDCTHHLNNICNDADKYWWEGCVKSRLKKSTRCYRPVFIVYYSYFQKRTLTSVNRHKINTRLYKPHIFPLFCDFSFQLLYIFLWTFLSKKLKCLLTLRGQTKLLNGGCRNPFFSCWVVFLGGEIRKHLKVIPNDQC